VVPVNRQNDQLLDMSTVQAQRPGTGGDTDKVSPDIECHMTAVPRAKISWLD